MDAELGALLWLIVEARIPLVVAGEPAPRRVEVRDALLAGLPPAARMRRLDGAAEAFGWLSEAARLGWRPEAEPGDQPARSELPGRSMPVASDPARDVLVADLVPEASSGTWGGAARVAIRALSLGYGMAATAGGTRLEDVLGRLAAFPVGAIDDELTRLGVVTILGEDDAGVVHAAAVHYLRPVATDVHGHLQRLPPAVLATWNPGRRRFDHFAWGVLDELAGRTGRRPMELEREQAIRAGRLSELARATGG